ncbi:D-arabinose 5-phosphate isomerase [hydrothermal vent metagenome]|uniref:D-arabinose 5-phosphate isomerase n=1 Tax=hydrothermal vent metagenome TaxID=652676 RepID=A0A3B0WEQ2_9ZZZZ
MPSTNTNNVTTFDFQALGREVVSTELTEITALRTRIDENFTSACELLLTCKGRIVVTGMGKSGHIGGKIAATLASTGSPAFFVHPGEASHGDLGMITKNDVVIALSNSGNTAEISTIIPILKRFAVPLISMTGDKNSTLANAANINLDVSVSKEACPHDLAPTSSTTVALVMGDALAVALLQARGFTAEDFALSHPGGSLGKRLLLHVSDIMHSNERIPKVNKNATVSEALLEMSEKGLGMTAIVDAQNTVLGLYTDGDLRRSLDKGIDVRSAAISDVMTKNCRTTTANELAASIVKLMDDHGINGLLVVDENNKLIGAFNMHDILRAGIV